MNAMELWLSTGQICAYGGEYGYAVSFQQQSVERLPAGEYRLIHKSLGFTPELSRNPEERFDICRSFKIELNEQITEGR